jgi:hypothetical protein
MKFFNRKKDAKSIQSKTTDYASLFLIKKELKVRQSVDISLKAHATISQIVKVISNREITVGGYIDNILMEHLERHKNEIIEMYNNELARNISSNLIEF